MTAPSEKLARSLNALHLLQERGVVAIRAADLPRTHRKRPISVDNVVVYDNMRT